MANCLAEFTIHGVPLLRGFDVEPVPEETFAYLLWATKQENIEDVFDWKSLPPKEEARQAVIRELIYTEADYIKHLMAIVETNDENIFATRIQIYKVVYSSNCKKSVAKVRCL
ncbi:unnamed protein product [Euphydryas editha]|uniref:DH domain-containing protein n=1 Tax=Euphydryas editha TaxID=104508 RepID=A0AAU9V0J0_EUPED|nr:unnamed protein product [Euphydryas editha]